MFGFLNSLFTVTPIGYDDDGSEEVECDSPDNKKAYTDKRDKEVADRLSNTRHNATADKDKIASRRNN